MKTHKYNKPYIKDSHNCYSYFLNSIDSRFAKTCKRRRKKRPGVSCDRPQPGYAAGFKKLQNTDYNCPHITRGVLADNKSIYKSTYKKKCKKGHYKGALFVDLNKDYHFYREDKKNRWSHKSGTRRTSKVDAKGNRITSPEKASKKYKRRKHVYDQLCDYFCIPSKTRKKMRISPIRKKH